MRLRTVDAFAESPFTGSPAAVVVLDETPPDEWMAAVARETNLSEAELPTTTDGVVTLAPPGPGDGRLLLEGRDEEFFRWFGPDAGNPDPVACVWVDGELIGWVDYDTGRDWLQPGEVNVGYYLFAAARGKGYASRAVELLLQHLNRDTEHTVATLLIHPENEPSLRLACRLGFEERGEVEGERFFARVA